jgi:hypothetical protein
MKCNTAIRAPGKLVGIAIRYGLTARGPKPGGGEILCTRPNRPWGPSSHQYNRCHVPFSGVKWLARGDDYTHTPSTAEVKERVTLFPCRPSRPTRGWKNSHTYLTIRYVRCYQNYAYRWWPDVETLRVLNNKCYPRNMSYVLMVQYWTDIA